MNLRQTRQAMMTGRPNRPSIFVEKGAVYFEGNNYAPIVTGDDNVINMNLAPLPQQSYRQECAGLLDYYTKTFVGREDWLSELVEFAANAAGQYFLLTAGPGMGKSALSAHLVHRHEVGPWPATIKPRLIYFFIRQESKQNRPDYFLHMVNSQLLQLLGLNDGIQKDMETRRSQFRDLWQRAAAAASQQEPLLLLIDGFDEMASGSLTIADLLPTYLGPHANVLVTSRPEPDPQKQVRLDHPLQTALHQQLDAFSVAATQLLLAELGSPDAASLAPRVWQVTRGEPLFVRFVGEAIVDGGSAILNSLEQNPPAGVVDYFSRQLNDLMDRAEGEDAWAALGLLLSAYGGMTPSEMASALERPLRVIEAALDDMQRFFLGQQRLEFNHAQLRLAVASKFTAEEQKQFTQKLIDWGGRHAQDGWQGDIPEYLLMFYAEHLANAGATERLYHLITPHWLELQLSREDSYNGFVEDVNLAIQTADAHNNLVEGIRQRLIFASLGSMANKLSPNSLGLMAALGRSNRARGYADLMADPRQQLEAYIQIGTVLAEDEQMARAVPTLMAALNNVLASRKDAFGDDYWMDDFTRVAHLMIRAGKLGVIQAEIEVLPVSDRAALLTRILRQLNWEDDVESKEAVASRLEATLTGANLEPLAAIEAHRELAAYYKEHDRANTHIDRALARVEDLSKTREKLQALADICKTLQMMTPVPIEKSRMAGQALLDLFDLEQHLPDFQDWLVNGVITLALSGEMEDALRFIEAMPMSETRLVLLGRLINDFSGQLGADFVASTASTILANLGSLAADWQKLTVLGYVLRGYTTDDQLPQALTLVETQLKEPALQAAAYLELATALRYAEERRSEVDTLVQRAYSALSSEFPPESDTLRPDGKKERAIAEAIDSGCWQLELLQKGDLFLPLAARLKGDEAREKAYHALVGALIRTGQLELATAHIEKLKSSWYWDSIHIELARAYLAANQHQKAAAILGQIETVALVTNFPPEMIRFRLGLLQTLQDWLPGEQQQQILLEATNILEQVDDAYTKADLLFWLVWAHEARGFIDQAIGLSKAAWEVSRDEDIAPEMFRYHINSLVRNGQVEVAKNVVAQLSAEETSDLQQQSLALGLDVLESMPEALAAARQIQNPVVRIETFGQIASRLIWMESDQPGWQQKLRRRLKTAVHRLTGHNLSASALVAEMWQVYQFRRETLSSPKRLACLVPIARVWCDLDPEQVEPVIAEMQQLPTGDDYFTELLPERLHEAIIDIWGQTGALDEAMAFINNQVSIITQVRYAAILASSLPMAYHAQVADYLEKMVPMLDTCDGPIDDLIGAYSSLIPVWQNLGLSSRLLNLATEILEREEQASDWFPENIYHGLIQSLLKMAEDAEPDAAVSYVAAARKIWQKHLTTAHHLGQDAVYRHLTAGTQLVADRDADQLMAIYTVVQEIESWRR